MPLDLLLPGLIAPGDAPPEMRSARLPAFETWLARADLSREAPGSAYDWLAAAYALGQPVPAAAVTLAGDADIRDGTWLRADPVHVRIEGERMSIHAGAALGIDAAEAHALASALQAHFREDALEMLVPSPTRWYLRVPPGEVPASATLDAAIASGSARRLPAAHGRINWPGLVTEVQMILAAHDVNRAREAAGRPCVNSVWLWGGGAMPANVGRVHEAIHADDPFARGIARLSGTRLAAKAVRPDAAQQPVLVVEDALAAALERGDRDGWMAVASVLDSRLEVALVDWIGRFGSVRLVLPSTRATLVAVLDARARWRVFRPRRPLAAYA